MKKIIPAALLFLLPSVLLAAPNVSDLTLNGNNGNFDLNINDGNASVLINLTSSEPVKWSTIAVCAEADDACSRSTAVKYFTQTSSFTETVEKSWNGTRSSGETVAAGEYKVKATVKNEAGEETIKTFSSPLIVVVEGEAVAKTNDGNDDENENEDDEEEDLDNNDDEEEGEISSHSSQSRTSNVSKKSSWKIGAGRDRRVLVDALVNFKVEQTSTTVGKYKWSFGDGAQVSGAKAAHRYSYPGVYEVVVVGKSGDEEVVARTKVTVVEPEIKLSWREDGGLVVENENNLEVNLGNFSLRTPAGGTYLFPTDTILSGKGKIILHPKLTHLNGTESLALKTPLDQVVATLPSKGEQAQALTLINLQDKLKTAQNLLAAADTAGEVKKVALVQEVEEDDSEEVVTLGAAAAPRWWERLLKLLRMP